VWIIYNQSLKLVNVFKFCVASCNQFKYEYKATLPSRNKLFRNITPQRYSCDNVWSHLLSWQRNEKRLVGSGSFGLEGV